MAKQIIILSKTLGVNGTDQAIQAAFWLSVAAGQQIPLPAALSAFRGASAAELAALKAGTVVEQIYAAQYPSTFTQAQIESALQTAYTAAQNAFSALPNPNALYGVFFDGTAWNPSIATLVSGILHPFQFGAALPATAGDNTIIAGAPNQTISIEQMIITATGPVTVEAKDGTAVIGGFQFGTGGGTYPLPFTGNPWFLTSPGNNFVLNLSAAVQCAITGWYQQA